MFFKKMVVSLIVSGLLNALSTTEVLGQEREYQMRMLPVVFSASGMISASMTEKDRLLSDLRYLFDVHPLTRGVESIGYQLLNNDNIFHIVVAPEEDDIIKIWVNGLGQLPHVTFRVGRRFFYKNLSSDAPPLLSSCKGLHEYQALMIQHMASERFYRLILLSHIMGGLEALLDYHEQYHDIPIMSMELLNFGFRFALYTEVPKERKNLLVRTVLTQAFKRLYEFSENSSVRVNAQLRDFIKRYGVEKGIEKYVKVLTGSQKGKIKKKAKKNISQPA